MTRIFSFLVAVALLATATNAQEEPSQTDSYSVFARFTPESRYEFDHSPWTRFLKSAVHYSGRSNRVPARRDDNTRQTGTKLSTSSKSRYRYEGNRILFSLFDKQAEEYVSVYRQALQDSMNRIDYGDLSRDEQLAFWLNLYNAVVIDEIARAHPISNPSRLRIRHVNKRLFDANLVRVGGVDLSLNDIRFNIVYRYWRNPNVIYGFWNGDIGSPNMQAAAFTGSQINHQLASNAREFVNSLRGVDRVRGKMRISKHYENARPFMFPNWPTDLYDHLAQYAVGEAAEIIAARPATVRASRYAFSTADIEGGETVRYSGNDNAGALAGEDLPGVFAKLSSTAMRGGYSGEAVNFGQRTQRNLSRRRGSAIIIDIYTDEPDNSENILDVTPDDDRDAANTTDGSAQPDNATEQPE